MSKGYVFKRGDVWWLQYSVDGRRYRETAKTTRKESAQALLRERLQSVWEGRFFPGKRATTQMTVGKLRDMWLEERASKRSIGSDKTRLKKAVEFFGEHKLVSTLTADDITAFRKHVAKDVGEQSTVNRYLAVLRSSLKLAAARGVTHQDPMRGIQLAREVNARDRICLPDEYTRLRDDAEGDLRALIVLGYWLGMRLGEIANLTWDRLDMQSGTIRLRVADTKEGRFKALPIPTEALGELKQLPRHISGRLFRYGVVTYSRQFAKLTGELKIKDLHFHDLRHTAATRMRRAGLDLLTIQAFTGHKTLAMLKRYSHVNDDDLREAMNRVEAHAAGRDSSKR